MRTNDPSVSATPVVLSPFTVSASQDTGYQATGTLSGTRINTSLRDIGTSIQAITPEFLEDTGVSDMTQLLQYTTSTEVTGGAGGNFSNASGSTAVFSADTNNRSTTPPTRIRGLADASISRNLYSSIIPFDSYNLSRVEINRGANSVLFGLGSPAGILNYNIDEPLWWNAGKVQVMADNYGTFREVLDLNQVVLKDKLAVRIIGLNNETKYRQDPSYRDDRRYFAAVAYRPFKDTTINVSYERGWINSSLPRQDPPRDYFTLFFPTGKISVPNNTDYRDAPGGTALIQFDSGATGNLRVFGDPNSGGENRALIQQPDARFGSGVVNPQATNPARANDFRWRTLALQNGREFITNVYKDPLGPNLYALGLVDPTVFDFFNNTIDGAASTQYGNIEAFNATLRQQFFHGDAGIELGYDTQTYNSGYVDILDGIRGNALMIDLNGGEFAYATPGSPSSGEAVNPHYLQPFVGSRGNFSDRFNKNETYRATAFLRHNFAEHSNSFFAKLLGTQSLTMLASSYETNSHSLSGQPQFMDHDQLVALGFTNSDARPSASGQLGNIFYLGNSVGARPTASGLNLQGFKGDFTFADQVSINYRDAATHQIKTATVGVHSYANTPHDQLATGASAARDNLDTLAAVLQSYWWRSALVSTLGWRQDKVERYTNDPYTLRPDGTIIYDPAGLDTNTPKESATRDTRSYSGVLHLKQITGRFMPRWLDLDLHYAWSENFQGLSGARAVDGGFYPGPTGVTKERGFSVGLFDQKLLFRANWFETSQANLTDPDIDQAITTVTGQLPTRLYQKYTLAQLKGFGFEMPPQLVASGLVDLGTADANGFGAYRTNYTPRDIQSSLSKGLELEATWNITNSWRLTFNAAKVESAQTGKGENWAPIVDWVKEHWFDNPTVKAISTGEGGSLDPVSGWEQRAVTDFISAQQRDGASNPEIRRWRFNAVTNYLFPKDSLLRGWGVGGGVRFQDRVFLGYRGKPDPGNPAGTYIADITQAQFGPTQTDFDFWLSYEHKIYHEKVLMKIQLNVRNAFTGAKLIPIQAQAVDDYSKYSAFDSYAPGGYRLYRIAAPRTIELRSTFSF